MVVCVRSLVPKEKNSATCAISRPQSGARQFNHGADDVAELHAGFLISSSATRRVACSRMESSFPIENERMHDLSNT